MQSYTSSSTPERARNNTRSRLRLMLLVALTPLSVSSVTAQQARDSDAPVRAVIAAWHAAEDALDTAAVRALVTENYFHVTSHGQVLSASDLMGSRATVRGPGFAPRYERGPITVVIHAAAALAHYSYEYSDGGSPWEGQYHNTIVVIEEHGGWKVASSHSSRVDPLAYVGMLELNRWPIVTLPPQQRDLYIGSYTAAGEIVTVWEEQGQLRITPGEDSPVEAVFLVPMGDHTFAQGHYEDGEFRRIYWPGTRIRFVLNDGVVQRYELLANGQLLETGIRRADDQSSAAAASRSPDPEIAITHVAVIDVRDGAVHPEQIVLVSGNRIAAVGPNGQVAIPHATRVVDGRGKYLIPGLWDMHVHSAASVEWHFPLFVAHGITGARNMHTSVDTALELTQAIKRRLAEGTLQGPRFLANGAVLDGPVALVPGAVRLGSAEAARAAVDSLAASGADFLKVYQRLSRDTYFALAEQAGRRGIPVVGHVPGAVRVAEAADAGQRSIEHILPLNLECSSQGDSIRALQRSRPPANYDEFVRLQHAFARSWSLAHCAPAIEAMRRNGTWFVPTMVIYWGEAHGDSALADRATVDLTPPEILREWETSVRDVPAWRREADAAILEAGRATLKAFHDAEVPLLAGTDVGNPLLVPGYSLHRELELLVAAGLTPLEALRTATINPARFLEATDSLGAIASGMLADLVLLDGSPLEDIRNTRRIAAVVLNGRYLDRSALDALLAAATAAERGRAR